MIRTALGVVLAAALGWAGYGVLHAHRTEAGGVTVAGERLCIPPDRVVFSEATLASSGDYDVATPGGFVRVRLPAETVIEAVPGFSPTLERTLRVNGEARTLTLQQSIGAMITPLADNGPWIERLVQDTHGRRLQPLAGTGQPGLWGLETRRGARSATWQVFSGQEPDGGSYWGSCTTMDPADPSALECRRHLARGTLSVEYPLAGGNIAHHAAIDRLLSGLLEDWRCGMAQD